MDKPLGNLRREYSLQTLTDQAVTDDPFELFDHWFDDAVKSALIEPNAMNLSTVSPDGQPSGRILLLKGFDRTGFTFYTSFQSRKAGELSANPRACLTFWWAELERQVRIEGTVERLPDDASDNYFASRPRESQLGAWVSEQSAEIPDRDVLERRLAELQEQFQDREIPRPPAWGGYRLIPKSFEFWQGREHRLHDRFRYTLSDQSEWRRVRLAP